MCPNTPLMRPQVRMISPRGPRKKAVGAVWTAHGPLMAQYRGKSNKKAVGWRAHGPKTQPGVSVDGRTTPKIGGIAATLLGKGAAENVGVVHSFHSSFFRNSIARATISHLASTCQPLEP